MVDDLAEVNPVPQEVIEGSATERGPTEHPARAKDALLATHRALFESGLRRHAPICEWARGAKRFLYKNEKD